jgi:hypothetical protein
MTLLTASTVPPTAPYLQQQRQVAGRKVVH